MLRLPSVSPLSGLVRLDKGKADPLADCPSRNSPWRSGRFDVLERACACDRSRFALRNKKPASG